MLENRMYTFLQLCEDMNYRIVAEKLNMTQPAVTQHIQYLEAMYGCKLFEYNGRKVTKTEAAYKLERYGRSILYNERMLKDELKEKEKLELKVGATKSIGGYFIKEAICRFLENDNYTINIDVDNTEQLLILLDECKLDFAMIEGFFDKNRYGYELIKKERFVGFTKQGHVFGGEIVGFEELFKENLIVREEGSGSRAILEQMLKENNYSINMFKRIITVSDIGLIKQLVEAGEGVTFGYETIKQEGDKVVAFDIEGHEIYREFNYVYLKNSEAPKKIELFKRG